MCKRSIQLAYASAINGRSARTLFSHTASLDLTQCLSILVWIIPREAVNRLVPAISLLWAVHKSRVYDCDVIASKGDPGTFSAYH